MDVEGAVVIGRFLHLAENFLQFPLLAAAKGIEILFGKAARLLGEKTWNEYMNSKMDELVEQSKDLYGSDEVASRLEDLRDVFNGKDRSDQ